MARVVLVNPAVILNKWGSYGGANRQESSLNHGLLSIATFLNKNGHKCSILDLRACSDMGDAIAKLMGMAPEVVGAGAMSVDFGMALEVLQRAKEELPWHPVTIVGGVHASISPEEGDKPYVDYVIEGEGELILLDMLDTNFEKYKDKKIFRGERPNLNELPFIDRSLVDYKELNTPYWKGRSPYVTMMAGRGCPFKCAFCQPVPKLVFGRTRQRDVSNIIQEMRECKDKYNAAYFDFIDDTFTININWVHEFCEQYKASKIGVPFVTAIRADIIVKNEQMIRELRRAGCDTVSVGFESGSNRILRLLNKGTTREMNLEAAYILRKHTFKIVANIMYGAPTETPQEARETTSMVKAINPDVYSPAWFTPYPGCALYDTYGHLLFSKDYKDLHRYRTKPKIRGVDYEAISKEMYVEG